MTIEKACELLRKKKHHILTKNYHDGFGRRYFLRNKDQKKVADLTEKQFSSIRKRLKNLTGESVISSDETRWYEVRSLR